MAGGKDVLVGKGTVRFKLGYRDAISDQGVSDLGLRRRRRRRD